MDNSLYRPKPNPYKILKHLKKRTREAADNHFPIHKYLCL